MHPPEIFLSPKILWKRQISYKCARNILSYAQKYPITLTSQSWAILAHKLCCKIFCGKPFPCIHYNNQSINTWCFLWLKIVDFPHVGISIPTNWNGSLPAKWKRKQILPQAVLVSSFSCPSSNDQRDISTLSVCPFLTGPTVRWWLPMYHWPILMYTHPPVPARQRRAWNFAWCCWMWLVIWGKSIVPACPGDVGEGQLSVVIAPKIAISSVASDPWHQPEPMGQLVELISSKSSLYISGGTILGRKHHLWGYPDNEPRSY